MRAPDRRNHAQDYFHTLCGKNWSAAPQCLQGCIPRAQPPTSVLSSTSIFCLIVFIGALRFLIFSWLADLGVSTCGGYPGILGHIETDAEVSYRFEWTKVTNQICFLVQNFACVLPITPTCTQTLPDICRMGCGHAEVGRLPCKRGDLPEWLSQHDPCPECHWSTYCVFLQLASLWEKGDWGAPCNDGRYWQVTERHTSGRVAWCQGVWFSYSSPMFWDILTNFFPHFLQPNYTKIAYYCNLWRNYNDIQVRWTKFP